MRNYLIAGIVAQVLGLGLAQQAFADIQIGLAIPRTGPVVSYGTQVLNGANAAIEDVNAKGGIGGEKLKLVIEDDACDPKNAVSVANRFVQQQVRFVIGHVCSGASVAASEVYSENQMIMISPSTLVGRLTDRGLSGIFRVCGRDDQQGAYAADYAIEHFKGKRIAIIHDGQAFARGLADVFQKSLRAKGITEVMFEGITPNERDYTAVISRLKANNVELAYYGGYQQEMGQLVRQSVTGNFKGQWMGTSGIATSEFASIAGSASDGVLMSFSRDPRKIANSAAVVASFRNKNIEPDGFTLYAYSAAQVLIDAIGATPGRDSGKVEQTIKSRKFETMLGEISFDKKGDITAPAYMMYVWKDGKFDYK